MIGTPTSTQPTRALPIQRRVSEWLQTAFQLTEATVLEGQQTELRAIATRLIAFPSRVVVVGETGRGKTTVLNTLLGSPVLPGEPTDHPIILYDPATGHPDVAPPVQLREMLEWTDDPIADEIVDTPGFNQPGDLPALRAMALGATAVVLVVSAVSPLGLSEIGLVRGLSSDLIGDRLLVVVTMLDRVEPAERDAVIRHISRRVAAVAPEAVTYSADQVEPIRRQLASIADASRIAQIGWHETTAQLIRSVAGSVVEIAAEQARAMEQRAAGIRASDAQKVKRLAESEVIWETLHAQLESRRLKAISRIQLSAQQSKAKSLQKLQTEVRSSPDPIAWARAELPVRQPQEIHSLVHLLERRIAQAFEEDLEWLTDQARTSFGDGPILLDPQIMCVEAARMSPPSVGAPNLALLRNGTKVAAAGVLVAKLAMSNALMVVLQAALISGAVVAAGSFLVNAGTRSATESVVTAISEQFSGAVSDLERQAESACDKLYQELDRRLLQVQHARPGPEPQDEVSDFDWAPVESKARSLIQQIDEELGNGAET